jgi:hypothetical protein
MKTRKVISYFKVISLSLIVFMDFFLISNYCLAAKVTGVDIFEYGLYEVKTEGWQTRENVLTGRTPAKATYKFIKQTDSIPAILGTHFGIGYVPHGSPSGEKVTLTYKTIFPRGIKDPKTGKILYASELSASVLVDVKSCKAYGLTESIELIPGEWKMEIWYSGKKMAEKSFTVYVPK